MYQNKKINKTLKILYTKTAVKNPNKIKFTLN